MQRRFLLMIGALAALLLEGCAETKVSAKGAAARKPVVLGEIASRAFASEREYSAILAPDAQTEESFRVPGYVTEILPVKGPDGRWRAIEAGMPVAAGAVLARIRSTDYQAVVDRARGSHAEAQAGIDAAKHQREQAEAGARQAELDFSRVEVLWRQESITKPAYDASLARRDAARAAVSAAEAAVVAAQRRAESAGAQVREAQIALGDTALVAPYAGLILERRVEKGSLVAAGTPVFTLADLRRVKAKFNVPDFEMGHLRLGQSLPVKLAALEGAPLTGRVLSIARAADAKARSFEVQLILDNVRGQLSAGMIATVAVPAAAGSDTALVVPAAAVVHDPVSGRDHVFVARAEQGRLIARFTHVTVSNAGSAQMRLLSGNLRANERVVVSGAMLLEDGDTIQEVRP